MAPSKAPSIQSFYKREVQLPDSNPPNQNTPSATSPGDGFTDAERAAALDPMVAKWEPSREYGELGIGELGHGPKAVVFVGRVVNVTTLWGMSAKEPRARGWHYVLLKDNGGTVSVCCLLPLVRVRGGLCEC